MISIKRTINVSVCGLFFLMMVFPTTLQPIKLILLSFILLLYTNFFQKWKMERADALMFLLSFCVIIIYTIIGVLNNNPGAIRTITVNLVFPIIYFYILGFKFDKDFIDRFVNLARLSTFGIIFISSIFLSYKMGYIPFNIADALSRLTIDIGGNYGDYNGWYEYEIYNISSLIFLTPILLINIISGQSRRDKKYIIDLFLLAFSVILCLLSGRRAFILIILLALPLYLISINILSNSLTKVFRQNMRAIVSISVIIITVTVILSNVNLGIDPIAIKDQFFEAFRPNSDLSSMTRIIQIEALLDEFIKRPFFGYGIGHAITSVVRSEEQPWAYEVMYIAMLTWFGVVGYIFFLGLFFTSLIRSLRQIRREKSDRNAEISILISMILFLVANATNPYLFKFDYLWILFIPVALNKMINDETSQKIQPRI